MRARAIERPRCCAVSLSQPLGQYLLGAPSPRDRSAAKSESERLIVNARARRTSRMLNLGIPREGKANQLFPRVCPPANEQAKLWNRPPFANFGPLFANYTLPVALSLSVTREPESKRASANPTFLARP